MNEQQWIYEIWQYPNPHGGAEVNSVGAVTKKTYELVPKIEITEVGDVIEIWDNACTSIS